jgi:hypothetical protein
MTLSKSTWSGDPRHPGATPIFKNPVFDLFRHLRVSRDEGGCGRLWLQIFLKKHPSSNAMTETSGHSPTREVIGGARRRGMRTACT